MRTIRLRLGLLLLLALAGSVRAADESCVTIEGLDAADDNFVWFIAPASLTVSAVGCHCAGTCASPIATLAIEDGAGNGITLSSTLTCSTGTTDTTFVNTDAGDADRNLTVGERLRFDVTNTPGTRDKVTLCVRF